MDQYGSWHHLLCVFCGQWYERLAPDDHPTIFVCELMECRMQTVTIQEKAGIAHRAIYHREEV